MSYSKPGELQDRWTDIFRQDTLIHLGILGSFTFAVFQGYLKDRIGGPLPYALADMSFIAAVGLWWATQTIRRKGIEGPGIVVGILLAVVLIPASYILVPGTPLLVKLAGARTWSEFPVGCLVALAVIKSTGQARAYMGWIVILCAITALYGLYQYQVGPESALNTALGGERHGLSVFYSVAGGDETHFRVFSTFNFPAPFAGFMVFGILIASGWILSNNVRPRIKLLATALAVLFFSGIIISGTRAAIIMLGVGLPAAAWLRGLKLHQIALSVVGIPVAYVATVYFAGSISERFVSLVAEEGLLWSYVFSPMIIASEALAANPLGLGLGRSGTGIPYAIFHSLPRDFWIGSDGDIGRATVELGIVGVVILLVIVFGLLPRALAAVRELRGSDSDDVALASGAIIISTAVLLLIGSPLGTAPNGTIWWFFLGILLKLRSMHRDALMEHQASGAPLEEARAS